MRICQSSILTVLPLILWSISWSADFEKGQAAYEAGDYQSAITEWQPLADAGHPDSQFSLGLLYANGMGVPFDNEQALKWYRLAADQNHAGAQYKIAVMHANGWGVPRSDEEAFKWYSLAAEQGVSAAQISVAKMYSGGFGAEMNNVLAHKWFSIASELGDSNAAYKRDDVAARMTAAEIAEAAVLAIAWMESYQNLHVNP